MPLHSLPPATYLSSVQDDEHLSAEKAGATAAPAGRRTGTQMPASGSGAGEADQRNTPRPAMPRRPIRPGSAGTAPRSASRAYFATTSARSGGTPTTAFRRLVSTPVTGVIRPSQPGAALRGLATTCSGRSGGHAPTQPRRCSTRRSGRVSARPPGTLSLAVPVRQRPQQVLLPLAVEPHPRHQRCHVPRLQRVAGGVGDRSHPQPPRERGRGVGAPGGARAPFVPQRQGAPVEAGVRRGLRVDPADRGALGRDGLPDGLEQISQAVRGWRPGDVERPAGAVLEQADDQVRQVAPVDHLHRLVLVRRQDLAALGEPADPVGERLVVS